MNLLRLHGKGGIQLFDADVWSEGEAREDYLELSCFNADTKTHEIKFDVLSAYQINLFVKSGSIDGDG
jgi:hypothetical protein